MNLCTHVWEYILAFFSLRPGELRSSPSPGINQLVGGMVKGHSAQRELRVQWNWGAPKSFHKLNPWWHLLIPYPDSRLLNFSPLFQFKRLQGKRNRGREEINFVEIKGDDQLSGAQQWMTKSLTEEKTMKSFSKVSGKGRSPGWPPCSPQSRIWPLTSLLLSLHLEQHVFRLVLQCTPSLPGTAPTFQKFAALRSLSRW